MKKNTMILCAFLISVALAAPSFAQEEQPGQAQVSPAEAAPAVKPAAPVKPKAPKKKIAKKTQIKEPAAETAAAAASQAPTPVPAPAVASQQVEAATVAPAAVSEAVKPESAPPSACPHCFQPLLAGYKGIIDDLDPWMGEMNVQAAALDQKLSAIQKQINEKESAIETARLGTDKKARKEAVKGLTRERKQLLKEYSAASGEKDAFYKKFSKEVEKRTEGYNKIVESKLNETLSAASQ